MSPPPDGSAPNKHEGAIERVVSEFEGRRITAVRLRSEWWFPARYVGRTIDQGDDGKRFVRNATDGESLEGTDYIRVAGEELAAVSTALNDGADSAPSFPEPSGRGGVRSMVLLSRTGLDLALIRSRTEIGKRMRAWLVREVLPSLRRTGHYATPGAPAANEVLVKLLQDQQEFTTKLVARLEALERRDTGPIGNLLAEADINSPIRLYAKFMALVDKSRSARSFGAEAHLELREALGFYGTERGWACLPNAQIDDARQWIRGLLRRADRHVARLGDAERSRYRKLKAEQSKRQLGLFKPEPKKN